MEGKEEEGDFRKRNQVKKEKKKEERTWFEKDLKGKESSRKQEYKRLKDRNTKLGARDRAKNKSLCCHLT